jgi:hypothetical protein
VRIEVLQGLAPGVTLPLPPQVTISQVSGPLVADWEAGSAGTLTVAFHDPLGSSTAFTVTGEVRGPKDGVVAVPLMRLPQAERETGGVAVDVLGAGEITDRQPLGFEAADALDLGEIVAGRESPSLVAFRAKPIPGSESRSLTVRVSRYATQASLVANIDEAR